MIMGITQGQVMPHRWSSASLLDGNSDFSSDNFGIANITALLTGEGFTVFRVTNLSISALFSGRGTLVAPATVVPTGTQLMVANFTGAGSFISQRPNLQLRGSFLGAGVGGSVAWRGNLNFSQSVTLSGTAAVIIAMQQRLDSIAAFAGAGECVAHPMIFACSAAFAGSGRLLTFGGFNTSTVFSASLGASGSILVNQSFRQIVTPMSAGGSYIRVSFKAGSSTYGLTNCSVGVQSTVYNTVSTPVELLFNGASGFSIASGVTITSDWVPLTFLSTDKIVVIGDAGARGGTESYTQTGVTGCSFYNKTSTNSYTDANPIGSWSLQGNTDVIPKIESAT